MLELLERRRLAIDQVMWQAPALVLAAQAFLFVVALNPATPKWGRIVVMLAGLSALVAASHSLTKQRYLEVIHSEAIMLCLSVLGLPGVYRNALAPLWENRLAVSDPLVGRHVLDPERWLRKNGYERLIVKMPSFEVWLVVFLVFAGADLVVIAKTIAAL